MSSELKDEGKGGAGSDQSLSPLRRRAVFARFLNRTVTSLIAGTIAFGSGTNLNDFGGSIAMGQTTPRSRRAEAEEIGNLQSMANDAAVAFRDYILTGDQRRLRAPPSSQSNPNPQPGFYDIYNRQYRNGTVQDSPEFMDAFFRAMERVRQNPQIATLIDAYLRDRDRVWGVRMEPLVMSDFLQTVDNIRSRLGSGPSDQDVQNLVRQLRESEGRAVRADSQVGRVRALVQQGMNPEDAARTELMRPAREDCVARYGQNLTNAIAGRMPRELARMAVIALRDFMLTGDTTRWDEFRRLFDANDPNNAFHEAFQQYFRERISRTTDRSGLDVIARAYGVHHGSAAEPRLDPSEFARMIAELYAAATSGSAEAVERIRQREGADVVDPLLGRVTHGPNNTIQTEGGIVARGMAQNAVNYIRIVLESGDPAARDAFINIMRGSLAVVVDGRVQSVSVENNDIFWNEFQRAYSAEITGNNILSSVVGSFRRNILPIAIRDIYSELAKANPDMQRLNTDYGPDLVAAVSSNLSAFSWLVRPEAALNREIENRAGYDDTVAVQIRGMRAQGFTRGRAISEIYLALVAERQQSRSIEGRDIIEQNYAQLSYLSGTPAAVQREIDRRAAARPPDPLAVAMRTRYGTNAGATLSASYSRITALRSARAQLARTYGTGYVELVQRNLDNMQWVLRPVNDIEREMRSRPDDSVLRGVYTMQNGGYTVGTIVPALQDIYRELGSASPDTSRLEQRYGAALVRAVQSNRTNLAWLGGDPEAAERALQDQNDPVTSRLRAFLYAYTPIQFVTAVTRARAAISRGGLMLSDTSDALGQVFITPVASRQAERTPPRRPDVVEQRMGGVRSTNSVIMRDLDGMERQLRRPILAPARPMMLEMIRRWRARALQIVRDGESAQDVATMDRLVQDQTRLANTMLTEQDLRKSTELAFSMIHLAETGGDINTQPQVPGVPSAVAQTGGLFTLLQWWRSFQSSNPDKAEAIGNVVSAVLRRADPQLFDFISGMDEPAYFDAVMRVYRTARGGGADSRANLLSQFPNLVGPVEALAPNLQVLERTGASMRSLESVENLQYVTAVRRVYRALTHPDGGENRENMVRIYGEPFVAAVEANRNALAAMGNTGAGMSQYRQLPSAVRSSLIAAYPITNELMVSITSRVYRAVSNPTGNENRDTMIALFGEGFVAAVEAQGTALAPLATQGAGVDQFSALPQSVRQALMGAYPPAYARSVGSLMRAFRRQDDSLFFATGAVYDAIARAPPSNAPAAERTAYAARLADLSSLYGNAFVQAVQANYQQLGFVSSPSSTVQSMRSLPAELLESLQVAFEAGPGPSRGTFMQNFSRMGDVLPSVYLNLRNAMVYATPNDQIATNMGAAVAMYRQYFGTNDYLFRQYVNLDLLNSAIPRLARRYNITLPPQYANGFATPEDLVAFMSARGGPGQDLIIRGRQFFDMIQQNFLLQRAQQSYDGSNQEDSNAAIQNLPNQISIFDALYLGIALERVSGTDSSFNRAAATAVMRSILFIENRDPYLVGPYLLQVLPALMEVAQDERTLVTAIEAFNNIVIQRIAQGQRDLSYSTALNRRYLLEVFARIGQRLPEVTSTFDHNRLEDELRLQPEPRSDEGYLSPYLYRYRPGWWRQGLEPLPTMFGQVGQPLSLLPRPMMATPGLYVPGVPTLLSDADGLYSRLSDQLVPPAARLFRQRVPARFRIGALGASTIVRRINELFGPMPVDYSDYWLNAFGETGAYYQHQEQGGTATDTGGAAAAASGRTITGGVSGIGQWTRQTQTTTNPPGATDQQARQVSQQTQDNVNVTAQAARLPYPIAGIIPLSVSGESGPTLKSESEIATELQRRVQTNDAVARALVTARPQGTAAALLDVYRELLSDRPDRARLERQYGRPFVELVEHNMSSLSFIEAPDRGVGLHRGRVQFNYQNATGRTDTYGGAGAPSATTGDIATQRNTGGVLETYSRIARESQTDMLVFVSGQHMPELRGQAPTPDAIAQQLGIPVSQYNTMNDAQRRQLAQSLGLDFDQISQGPELQQQQERLKSRMYFVTREGNIYQLAYGIDTEAQLLNYMYAGANTQQYLAGVRMVGRDSLVSPGLTQAEQQQRQAAGRTPVSGDAARGFDGAAIGFTLPTGGGDSFSSLAFGQLVRDMNTMTPVHAEQATGMAVTNLLADRRQRDIYAAFYRGSQIVQTDPANVTHITNTSWAEGIGEVMWRRMRVDPLSSQFELRVAGGYPGTAAASWRHEIRSSRYRTTAYGISGGFDTINLLQQFRAVDAQADQIYARMNTVFANLYGWQEDEARNTGWLVAGSYLYARMEDWTVRNPNGTYTTTPTAPTDTGTPAEHYASALFMYWAQRHNLLMGAQRVPGFSRIYDRIDQAMRDVQNNPENSAQILQALSQNIRNDMNSDIWRFALGYGYDGERVRVYVLGSGQYQRIAGTVAPSTQPGGQPQQVTPDYQTSYADLYGLFLFGRPTRVYTDILAHSYLYAPLVIGADPSNPQSITVTRGATATPYSDLWMGVGAVDWPSISLERYERELVISRSPDLPAALADIYVDIGGVRDRARLGRVYGEELVAMVEQNRASLNWMIRPENEVTAELERRRAADDNSAQTLLNFRNGSAAALIDIFTEMRKATPDRDRLERRYSRDMVDFVVQHASDFSFVLLPHDRLQAELERRQGASLAMRERPLEARLSEVRMPLPPAQDNLTGEEVVRMFERNKLDVLVAATNAQTRSGLSPERYNVLPGSHLDSREGRRQRSNTFYILHSPVIDRPGSTGSIVVGDEEDMRAWVRNGAEIGGGISRVEVSRQGEGYRFVFSGDRRLRAFTAERLVGGFTIPLTGDAYGNHDFGHNWTVGLLMRVLQDHRQDLIAGALYGVRQFGNERWDQATVTFSHRLQLLNTTEVSNQLFSYVFFNRTTQKIVFATNDVFQDPQQLADVCSQMGIAACANAQEFQRTTVGAGITWARANLQTSERLSLHLFFEGGVESGRTFAPQGGSQYTNYNDRFVWRGGVGFDYLRQAPQSILPERYFLNLQTTGGTWPLIPGEIGRPEYLGPYRDQIYFAPGGWSVMLHGGFQW